MIWGFLFINSAKQHDSFIQLMTLRICRRHKRKVKKEKEEVRRRRRRSKKLILAQSQSFVVIYIPVLSYSFLLSCKQQTKYLTMHAHVLTFPNRKGKT